MQRLLYLRGVTTLELDEGRCKGCRTCTRVCPHGVLEVDGGRARIVVRDACMECGACARNCSTGALSVDSGVGCASALMRSAITGSDEVCCGPNDGASCC